MLEDKNDGVAVALSGARMTMSPCRNQDLVEDKHLYKGRVPSEEFVAQVAAIDLVPPYSDLLGSLAGEFLPVTSSYVTLVEGLVDEVLKVLRPAVRQLVTNCMLNNVDSALTEARRVDGIIAKSLEASTRLKAPSKNRESAEEAQAMRESQNSVAKVVSFKFPKRQPEEPSTPAVVPPKAKEDLRNANLNTYIY